MRKLFILATVITALAVGRTASANVDLDLSGSSITGTAQETITIHNVTAWTDDGVPLGFFPTGEYWVDLQWDPINLVFVPVNYGSEPQQTEDPNLTKSKLLLGQWHFVFTIISTFTDDYTLSSVDSTPNSDGEYFVHGTDQYGGPIAAGYYPPGQFWSLLDPGSIIDEFYVFYTDGSQILPGSCYYQANPYTLQITSNCYSLSGYKTSSNSKSVSTVKSLGERYNAESLKSEQAMPGSASPEINSVYRSLREKLER
jgi:hypothetical protein